MSDHNQADGPDGSNDDTKHEAARKMAEAAMRAQEAGDVERANILIEQAQKADPEAVMEVVEERGDARVPTPSNDEIGSTLSDTVMPNSDAPSRAGISGSGSGADNQGL